MWADPKPLSWYEPDRPTGPTHERIVCAGGCGETVPVPLYESRFLRRVLCRTCTAEELNA